MEEKHLGEKKSHTHLQFKENKVLSANYEWSETFSTLQGISIMGHLPLRLGTMQGGALSPLLLSKDGTPSLSWYSPPVR